MYENASLELAAQGTPNYYRAASTKLWTLRLSKWLYVLFWIFGWYRFVKCMSSYMLKPPKEETLFSLVVNKNNSELELRQKVSSYEYVRKEWVSVTMSAKIYRFYSVIRGERWRVNNKIFIMWWKFYFVIKNSVYCNCCVIPSLSAGANVAFSRFHKTLPYKCSGFW